MCRDKAIKKKVMCISLVSMISLDGRATDRGMLSQMHYCIYNHIYVVISKKDDPTKQIIFLPIPPKCQCFLTKVSFIIPGDLYKDLYIPKR